MFYEMLFKSLKGFASGSGINFLLDKIPADVRNFIVRTGITRKDILERLFNGKIAKDDMDFVSQNTLESLSPYVANALQFMSKQAGENVAFCLALREEKLEVVILKDNAELKNQAIEGASFPFEFLVTAIINQLNKAKVESSDLTSNEQSANQDVSNLIADPNVTIHK